MKTRESLWRRLYPLLLMGLLVLSLLGLVRAGTGVYGIAVDGQRRADAARAALSYLAARVRAADAAGAVSVGAGPEGDALLLRETAAGEVYETRIYLYDGALCEEYSAAAQPLRPESAERIVALQEFSVQKAQADLLSVRTEYGAAHIALRSGEEAADGA